MISSRYFFIVVVLLQMLAPFPLFAKDNGTAANGQKTTLSYNTYIEKIRASLPEIKSNAVEVQSADNAIKRAKSAGDVSLNGSTTYSYSTRTMNTGTLYSTKSTSKDVDYSVGASKRILTTGTDVSLDLGYSPSEYRGYMPSATFKVSQPLLYNFFGKVDRYAEKNAKMKAEIARVQLLENNKSVLNAYKNLYFQWLLNMKILDEIKESIKNSKVQRDQIAANTRAGLSEEDDYQRTVATVMTYENQYTEYLTSLRNIENQLSLYIDTSAIMPDQSAFTQYYRTSSAFNFDFISFEKTNSYRIVDLTLKNLDYSRGVYENKLLPTLNAFASITKKDITDYSSDAYSRVPGYKVGIEFTYKLGNNAAESDLEDVKLQIQSIKYEYDKTHNDYKKNLLKLQEYARSAIKEIKTTTAILDSLRLRLITEKRKYGQGRLALSYIIDTKNSIASYNISLMNLKYQLISYYLDYKDLTE